MLRLHASTGGAADVSHRSRLCDCTTLHLSCPRVTQQPRQTPGPINDLFATGTNCPVPWPRPETRTQEFSGFQHCDRRPVANKTSAAHRQMPGCCFISTLQLEDNSERTHLSSTVYISLALSICRIVLLPHMFLDLSRIPTALVPIS